MSAKERLMLAVKTIALRDYVISGDGQTWTGCGLEQDAGFTCTADSKRAVFVRLVEHIMHRRRAAIHAETEAIRGME